MAMGSYFLGATVRIPLQITDSGIPFTENVSPKIKQIIKPDGTSAYSGSQAMSRANQTYGAYYYDYIPESTGDYVIIITYTIDEVELSVMENFTVNSRATSTRVPRAEAR